MDLILQRHPAVAVPAGVCYGRSDVALQHTPEAELQRCMARLAGLHPAVTVVHTSPLSRCLQIAAPLAARLGVPLRSDARLQELDFGRWEMQAWDAIPREEIDAWAADLEHAHQHGGESVAMLAARLRPWLDALPAAPAHHAQPQPSGTGGETVVAVTHAGVMRVLAALALGLPLACCVNWHLALGGWCQLRHDAGLGRWTLVSWNGA